MSVPFRLRVLDISACTLANRNQTQQLSKRSARSKKFLKIS
jgi:hypothetical protein